MVKKFCDSPIHKGFCLILAFILISFCILPSFASADPVRPNEPVGYKEGDTFRDIVLAVLDSWGISFTKDSSDTKSILEYSDELMEEFYEDNQTTQELFWEAVKYGVNSTGDLILDFLGVNKIRQFANWLIDKFSLTDSSSTPTYTPASSFVQFDGVSYPIVPYDMLIDNGARKRNGVLLPQIQSYLIPYGSYTFDNGLGILSLSGNRYSCSYSGVTPPVSLDGTLGSTNNVFAFGYRYSVPSELTILTFSSSYPNNFPSVITGLALNPSNPFYYLFDNVVSSTPSSSIVINTTVINIPSDNDISPTDGIKIEIPGTNWGDSLPAILDIIERLIGLYDSTQLNVNTVIELLTTLLKDLITPTTVENIPGGVTLDYDDYDIPLEDEWDIVTGFFDSELENNPFSTLSGIIYGFPQPFVIFFSVVIVFVVAYGFIRMGRDSH